MDTASDAAARRPNDQQISKLRFEQPLEGEFRDYYRQAHAAGMRSAMVLALALIAAMALVQWLVPDASVSPPYLADLPRLSMLALLASIPLAMGLAGLMPKRVPQVLVGVGLGAGALCLLSLPPSAANASVGSTLPALVGITVVTLYGYALCGLRLYLALLIGIPLMLGYIVFSPSGMDPNHWLEQLTALAFVNLVGVMLCYRQEYAARNLFLEREVLHMLAATDPLTGIPNRRLFNRHLHNSWRQARRDTRAFAVLLIDIDHFKAFNDHYGHQAGDATLRRIAQALSSCARRPLDFTARFGGEEFAMVLFDPDPGYIENVVKRIRDQVALLDIPHKGSPTSERLTVSIGVALAGTGSERSADGLLQLADEAMYEAKDAGRNGFVIKDAEVDQGKTGVFRGPWSGDAAG